MYAVIRLKTREGALPGAAVAAPPTAATAIALACVVACKAGENPFAEAAVGDANARRRPFKQQGVENGAAANDEVGAFLPDAGLACALVKRH